MIRYVSTRGDAAPKTFIDVLLSGMAPDGGLYVPAQWPQIKMEDLKGLTYQQIAFNIMKPFVGDDIPDADLKSMINDVYGVNFNHPKIAPLVEIEKSFFIMELFHGPTLAFKDYALQMLGHLFDYTLQNQNQHVTIVGATSGDTGSAAIEGCRHSKNINIFILHPKGRTSEVQRRQMTTVKSDNVHNIALEGNFDDCQNAVKAMFADDAFRTDINLSAVNSINWARIMAQIVYYFNACASLGADESHKISFAVPTGNFGNVYAAYCAKRMGAPIDRLIIGSNRNDILTRFFETGKMTTGEVEPSLSPSMDIQVSSNFERFLFDLCSRDGEQVKSLMDDLKSKGEYALSNEQMLFARQMFESCRCDDERTSRTMSETHKKTGYLLDPHTAVGVHSAKTANMGDKTVVALACAHPAKFPDAVKSATDVYPSLPPHMADLYNREEFVTTLPNNLAAIQKFIKQKAL